MTERGRRRRLILLLASGHVMHALRLLTIYKVSTVWQQEVVVGVEDMAAE